MTTLQFCIFLVILAIMSPIIAIFGFWIMARSFDYLDKGMRKLSAMIQHAESQIKTEKSWFKKMGWRLLHWSLVLTGIIVLVLLIELIVGSQREF